VFVFKENLTGKYLTGIILLVRHIFICKFLYRSANWLLCFLEVFSLSFQRSLDNEEPTCLHRKHPERYSWSRRRAILQRLRPHQGCRHQERIWLRWVRRPQVCFQFDDLILGSFSINLSLDHGRPQGRARGGPWPPLAGQKISVKLAYPYFCMIMFSCIAVKITFQGI